MRLSNEVSTEGVNCPLTGTRKRRVQRPHRVTKEREGIGFLLSRWRVLQGPRDALLYGGSLKEQRDVDAEEESE